MIHIKTDAEIEQMKVAGAVSKAALRHVGASIKPGVLTSELDAIAESFIRMHGGVPAFKGLYGFPSSICCSINEEVVHGIPSSQRMLQEGDIVSIDTGATIDNWVGDNAWTFYCGEVSSEAKALCEVTLDCLRAGIRQATPGNHVGDIGAAIQALAEKHGYGILREYTGHGVGHVMHEDPTVYNYGRHGRGPVLRAGMVIAIEPMITLGDYSVETGQNGWTVSTVDHSLSAHYENTVAITKDGPVILTADDEGPWCSMKGGE